MSAHDSRNARLRAFTLIELMMVVAIVGVLAALAAPNFFSMIRSEKLRSEAELVSAIVENARSHALSTSRPVKIEVSAGGDRIRIFEVQAAHPLGQIGTAASLWEALPLQELETGQLVVDTNTIVAPLIFQPYRGASSAGSWKLTSVVVGEAEYSLTVFRVTGLIQFRQVL